jgi:N-formylglutamate deformylase
MAYIYTPPKLGEIPIIFSSPHSGRLVPQEIFERFSSENIKKLPDTDFDIDKLYDFVPNLGAHLLCAEYNRYFVDLNRSLDSQPLYKDGRSITELIPLKSFDGEQIYQKSLSEEENVRRIEKSYIPYHSKIKQLIVDLKTRYKKVLLFECHSIARNVQSIQQGAFPDLMVGTDDGKSIQSSLESLVTDHFLDAGFDTSLNSPFKGGFITRNYHDIENGVFTIQLEMSKDLYLDTNKNQIDRAKASKITGTLKSLTKVLAEELIK